MNGKYTGGNCCCCCGCWCDCGVTAAPVEEEGAVFAGALAEVDDEWWWGVSPAPDCLLFLDGLPPILVLPLTLSPAVVVVAVVVVVFLDEDEDDDEDGVFSCFDLCPLSSLSSLFACAPFCNLVLLLVEAVSVSSISAAPLFLLGGMCLRISLSIDLPPRTLSLSSSSSSSLCCQLGKQGAASEGGRESGENRYLGMRKTKRKEEEQLVP